MPCPWRTGGTTTQSGARRASTSQIPNILRQHESELLENWLREQSRTATRGHQFGDAATRQEAREFLGLLAQATVTGETANIDGPQWEALRSFLGDLSRSRAQQGFTPSETAMFVFSFKQPLFEILQRTLTPEQQAGAFWDATLLLDRLGLYVTEVYQEAREAVINRQQQEMMELSTPVVKLWNGVLALPIIGTLDSGRTQTIMENLLQRIVETGSETAIIDITGVPTVDTLTAQHLIKTVTAARLIGTDCIVSGIRPQIAQTIVQLGVELGDGVAKASLADAFALALRRGGLAVVRRAAAESPNGSSACG